MKLIIEIEKDYYEIIKYYVEHGDDYKTYKIIANGSPYEERPQGEWEYVQYDANPNIGNWHCSECRHIVSGKYNQKPDYNFCPNCGARMQKGGAE